MRSLLTKTAFTLLVLACLAAALLLFMPGREQSDTRRGAAVPEATAPSPEMPAPPSSLPASDPAVVGLGPGEWNTYHGDHALTGVVSTDFSKGVTVLWRIPTGSPVRQPPVASGGRIFIVTARSEILACDLEGQILWRHELAAGEAGAAPSARVYVEAPIAAFENKVLVGDDEGVLVALHADTGEIAWRSDLGGPVRGTPNYLPGTGNAFVLDQDTGALACIDTETGVERWRSAGVDRADGSPAISEGVSVFGSCASALHVVDTTDGALLRDIRIENGGGQVAGGVALVGGYAYAGSRDGRVMQADIEAGILSWVRQVSEDEVFSTPAVHGDWLLVTSFDGMVHALGRATGDIRWQKDVGGVPASPVIAGDQVIVASDGVLFLLNLEDGETVWETKVADEITGPAVLPNMLVVGTEDGTLTAFGVVE